MNHETDSFMTGDGLRLFTQRWLPDELCAVVILSHGGLEHSGRYGHVAEYLAAQGFGVYALDHRGHGRSEGERAYVRVFREYVNDLKDFCEKVRERHPDARRFLLGCSVGGVISLQLVLEHPEKVDGVAVSSAYLRNAVQAPAFLFALQGFLHEFLPRFPTVRLDAAALSRDPEVVRAYETDPLVYRDRIKVRFAAEQLAAGAYVLEHARSLHLPILIMHGTADRIADPSGSRALYADVASADKTLNLYEGLYHELFNEPGKERVLADLVAWLEIHLEEPS